MKLIAVTNNSLIDEALSDKKIFGEIIYDSCCSHEDVLKISKGMVLGGHKLLINPFFGVIPPYEMPFKTIVLSKCGDVVDFNSLNIISGALLRFQKLNSERLKAIWNKNSLDDFKKSDLVIIERWLVKVYNPTKFRRT